MGSVVVHYWCGDVNSCECSVLVFAVGWPCDWAVVVTREWSVSLDFESACVGVVATVSL